MSDETQGREKQRAVASAGIGGAGSRTLIVLALQGAEGRIFRMHKERIVLGSVVSSDVRLTGEGVAPIHAVIELSRGMPGEKPRATIYDLASESGLFVNGSRTVTQELKAGDEIGIGPSHIVFSLEDVDVAARTSLNRDSGGQKLFGNPKEDLRPLLLEDSSQVEEIFDFRPTSRPALEVVMSWHGTILDVEHFTVEKAVTVGGEKRSHFGIPPILGSGRYAILTRSGDEYVLNIDSQMKGIVQRKGRLVPISQLGSAQVPLGKDEFAKVSIGEVDFYMSYTAAPPRLKRRKLLARDPFLFKVIVSSLLMTALVSGVLLKIDVPQTLEAEKLPDRLATVLYQPEKYTSQIKQIQKLATAPIPEPSKPKPPEPKKPEPKKPEPKPTTKVEIQPKSHPTPRPVPKEMDVAKNVPKPVKPAPVAKSAGSQHAQNQAQEGEGARAKGKEGSRGSKNAKPGAEHQKVAMRPSAQGGAGRGGGNSQVQDEGNVDFLKGASNRIQNLLGSTAANLGKGGEKLQGFGGFTTQGNGGLALSGSGQGGGGDAASLGGLSDKGRGGGRVGTGLGAAGNGSGIIGGKSRVVIRSGGPEEAVVTGSIDADAIEAAMFAHRDEFRLCYEKEVNAENPKLAGRVGTNFMIGSSGRVTQAGIESTSLKNANVERCILAVIKRIDFPVPRGGGTVNVSYPFKYSPIAGR